jgi:hypothetical protein
MPQKSGAAGDLCHAPLIHGYSQHCCGCWNELRGPGQCGALKRTISRIHFKQQFLKLFALVTTRGETTTNDAAMLAETDPIRLFTAAAGARLTFIT